MKILKLKRKSKSRLYRRKIKKKNKLLYYIKYFGFLLLIPIGLIIVKLVFINKNSNTNTYNNKNNSIFNNIKHRIYNSMNNNINNAINILLNLTFEEENKNIQEYVNLSLNGTLLNPNKVFHKSTNPKISIVIALYNAEHFIHNAILSIQNQNFDDIEIIIIDDYSNDNSVNKVEELMKNDPRILLYKNKENLGILYSKTKGIMLSKGKYVMILDQDDLFPQKDVFSTLYYEIEKENLDILRFAYIVTGERDIHNIKSNNIFSYEESEILSQSDIINTVTRYKEGKTEVIGHFLWDKIYRTNLFKKTIGEIDNKFLETKTNCMEDFLLYFLLSRNANKYKQIKRIFYFQIHWNYKYKNDENIRCMSYLNYIEVIFMKTNNTFYDKRFASHELNIWFLNHNCKNNIFIQSRAKLVCKMFLENPFIENDVKDKIRNFFSSLNP